MSEPVHKRVSLQTVGCRLNQYETERMATALYPYGFRRVGKGEVADLYIINTCTVTHRADSDNRYLINRAARENPNARIVVAGCYVDNDPELVAGMEAVDVIISNQQKEQIAQILPERLPDLFDCEPEKGCAVTASFERYNRAWVKISDGCNQRCSFCVLPRVRGRLQNRPSVEVIDEINCLVQAGFSEVALTGLHIGHYRDRQSEPVVENLAAFCRMILSETDLPRLRLSSIEPQTVRDDLLQLLAEPDSRICRHIHMPLQSGSERILKLMRRPYTPEKYLLRAKAIKKANSSTIIGADVIVGFPGETEEDFEQSQNLAQCGLIDYLHVFSYSDRSNTDASELPDKNSPQVIKERNTTLTRISNKLRAASYKRQVGQILGIIAERKRPERPDFMGISDNYIRVKLPHSFEGGRQIVPMRITSATDGYVEGEFLPQ